MKNFNREKFISGLGGNTGILANFFMDHPGERYSFDALKNMKVQIFSPYKIKDSKLRRKLIYFAKITFLTIHPEDQTVEYNKNFWPDDQPQ